MSNNRPDYFAPVTDTEEHLRRIKGNYRREMIREAIERDGLESVPRNWLNHNLSKALKNVLGNESPACCGGEDLPNLEDGEVEIARVSLVDSVHGEVTSLRAKRASDGEAVQLRIVDEYEEDYVLKYDFFSGPLTAEEVLQVFRESEPCACESSCQQRFSSDFYPGLDELADKLEIKQKLTG